MHAWAVHPLVRLVALALALPALACQPASAVFEHVAVVDATTSGVVVGEEPTEGVAGMGGLVCAFSTDDGSIGDEWALDGGEREKVQDVDDATGRVLAVGVDGVHVLGSEYDPAGTLRWSSPAVRAARLASEGLFALDEHPRLGCVAAWQGEGRQRSHEALDASACRDLQGLAYDRDADVAFVATDRALLRVDRAGGQELLAEGAVALAHDPGRGLYAALDGGAVSGLEDDGAARWSTELEGQVVALAPAGRLDGVLVAESLGDGSGRLYLLDGADGAELGRVEVPVAGYDLVTGAGGELAVLVLDHELHVFGLDPSRLER